MEPWALLVRPAVPVRALLLRVPAATPPSLGTPVSDDDDDSGALISDDDCTPISDAADDRQQIGQRAASFRLSGGPQCAR